MRSAGARGGVTVVHAVGAATALYFDTKHRGATPFVLPTITLAVGTTKRYLRQV